MKRGMVRTAAAELHPEIGSIQDELRGEIGLVRHELSGEVGTVRSELGSLRDQIQDNHAALGSIEAVVNERPPPGAVDLCPSARPTSCKEEKRSDGCRFGHRAQVGIRFAPRSACLRSLCL